MVRHRPLEASILVRIQASEQGRKSAGAKRQRFSDLVSDLKNKQTFTLAMPNLIHKARSIFSKQKRKRKKI